MKRILLCLLASILWLGTVARPVKGRVICEKEPVGNVLLTDGHTFARTDANGAYELDLAEGAHFVAMVTPAGYVAPAEEGFPRFYRAVEERTSRYDFELLRWGGPHGRIRTAGHRRPAAQEPQPLRTAGAGNNTYIK